MRAVAATLAIPLLPLLGCSAPDVSAPGEIAPATPTPSALPMEASCQRLKRPLADAEKPVKKLFDKKSLTGISVAEFSEPLEALRKEAARAPAELSSDLASITDFLAEAVNVYDGGNVTFQSQDFYVPFYKLEDTCKKAGGPSFSDGRYIVDVDVKPGTYEASPTGSGCYWERLDYNGETIDNNFSQGSRVEVTIESDDYTFFSEGCGTWTVA